ncbi:hypothetical protein [Brevundimonas sp.]|uniref:hypothetical protein n=1 Tax=Brevundimonas sp. TaxID=1871086 RepID=UPI002D61B522|nr:hypothetical protein [Brevundimonas sp.]HYD26952.1 hypothetical protein [Brevundimonas sp.]
MRKVDLSVMQFALGLVCILSILSIAVLSFFVIIPEGNQRILDVITGALLTVGFANIIGFLFGQKETQAAIERAAVNATAGQTVIEPPAEVTVREAAPVAGDGELPPGERVLP